MIFSLNGKFGSICYFCIFFNCDSDTKKKKEVLIIERTTRKRNRKWTYWLLQAKWTIQFDQVRSLLLFLVKRIWKEKERSVVKEREFERRSEEDWESRAGDLKKWEELRKEKWRGLRKKGRGFEEVRRVAKEGQGNGFFPTLLAIFCDFLSLFF